jgi:hypothetical protein
MRFKVRTAVQLTQEQLATLQRHGCRPIPYITWDHEWVFAAYCEDGQEQELRNQAWRKRREHNRKMMYFFALMEQETVSLQGTMVALAEVYVDAAQMAATNTKKEQEA